MEELAKLNEKISALKLKRESMARGQREAETAVETTKKNILINKATIRSSLFIMIICGSIGVIWIISMLSSIDFIYDPTLTLIFALIIGLIFGYPFIRFYNKRKIAATLLVDLESKMPTLDKELKRQNDELELIDKDILELNERRLVILHQ